MVFCVFDRSACAPVAMDIVLAEAGGRLNLRKARAYFAQRFYSIQENWHSQFQESSSHALWRESVHK